ncbi:uncharacterized protein LOC111123685 [Crassostrea virginica]
MIFVLILCSTLIATEIFATSNTKDGPKIPCAFDTYDANHDDVITRNEFFQATTGLPQTTSATIFIRMDNDHDGSIQRDEFRFKGAILMRGVFNHCLAKCGWWSDCSSCRSHC